MIWFVGKSGVKYGNLSKWLEITLNFSKMIAYAFFHEKNRFQPVKLIFVSFQLVFGSLLSLKPWF